MKTIREIEALISLAQETEEVHEFLDKHDVPKQCIASRQLDGGKCEKRVLTLLERVQLAIAASHGYEVKR